MRAIVLVLGVLVASSACATARPPTPRRLQSATDERSAALRANDAVADSAAVEERFSVEQARARREEQKARQAERSRRVEAVDQPDGKATSSEPR